MNENENNFESLRRLLALKRHETPPPGYFNNFSRQVLQRIRASHNEPSVNLLEELFSHAPWLAKLLQALDMRPVLAGGFAGTLCMLLLFGIVYAERPDITPQPLLRGRKQFPFARRRVADGTVTTGGPDGDRVQHRTQCSVFSRSLRPLDSKIRSPSRSIFHFPAAINPV